MASGANQPFLPAETKTISASGTSAGAQFTASGQAVLVYNAASVTAFVRVGNGTQVATTADTPVPAGGRLLLGANDLTTHCAAITGGTAGNVYFTIGNGSVY